MFVGPKTFPMKKMCIRDRDKHSPSAWKMSNALESWSWNGCEGKDAKVEVYARAAAVELYVNDQLVGKKKLTNDCKVTFHTTYHDGEIKAVALGAAGEKIAEKILKTAGQETVLTLQPEDARVNREGGLCFVRLQYTDKEENVKPLVRGDITVSVQNGELLAVGSARCV